MRLANKIAVITGTASGIGRASALLFASEGASVVCVDWNGPANDETVSLVRDAGGAAAGFTADVGDEQAVAAVVQACEGQFDRVDVLFNNAGQVHWARIEDTPLDAWNEMLRINLTGPYLCSRLFLPLLKRSGKGSVIHNGSVDGLLGNPRVGAYSASKGGLVPLTHVMAWEFGKYNIRVNCIAPGGIQTGMSPQTSGPSPMLPFVSLHRAGGADEVAHAALYFASDESSYTSGAVMVVDGGRTCLTHGTLD